MTNYEYGIVFKLSIAITTVEESLCDTPLQIESQMINETSQCFNTIHDMQIIAIGFAIIFFCGEKLLDWVIYMQ